MINSPRTLLALAVLLLAAWPVAAQTPPPQSSVPETAAAAQEGYLLADELYAAPDPFSDKVPAVGRTERVRVVPVDGKEGWHAVYTNSATEPSGYAFRPYVSRLGTSDLAALQQPEGTGLPEVVLAEGITEADGVLTRVEVWANVRVGPGVSAEAFGVLRPDVPFRVVAIERGWGKVKLQGEPGFGYVAGSLLRRVEEAVAAEAEEEAATGRSALTVSGASAGGSATLGDDAEAEDVSGVEETTGIVYVTRTGHKYHRATCKHLRSVKFALPLAEAMMDFAPCRTCRPPTRLPDDLPAP